MSQNMDELVLNCRFRGCDLPVVQAGEGRPLGYLHGPLGNQGEPPLVRMLGQQGWQVTAPSLPGFANPYDGGDLRTLHDWIMALSEIVDATGLAGRPLVASSIGAMLALELAAIRPEAFSELILIAPFGLWDVEEPIADIYANLSGRERPLLAANSGALTRFFEDKPELAPSEVIEGTVQRHITRAAAASILWPIPEFGLADRAYRIACPVTLIWGSEDAVVPVSYRKKFERLLPHVRKTVTIRGAGHMADYDDPAAVAVAVLSVIDTR